MDSLLRLSTPHHQLEIPLFGDEVYDNLGFLSYPDRRGWNPRHIRNGDYGNRSSVDAASFIQAWLFFGTISQVTGVSVRGTNFIRFSDFENRLVVTTERLGFYLDIWRAKAKSETASDRQERLSRERARICLDFMVKFTESILLVPEHPEVAVSIEILLVVLVETFKDIFGPEAWDVPSEFASDVENRDLLPGGNQYVIKYLKTRMISQGWCPHRLASFGDTILSDALYTLSLMGTRELLSGHGRCSEDGCVGNHVDDSTYNATPRHVKEGCQCGFVKADVEKIVSIIEKRQIPVTTVVWDSDTKQVYLKTVPYDVGMSYIAISHVWAHGLGNPDENALRTCQVRELEKLVKRALEDQDLCEDTNTVYFWIDTLCLPLRPLHARKTGIKQMRSCYEAASAVLVLDKHLRRSTAYTPSTTMEPLLQIAICDWRFRVWTLQEAIFARRLIFQFLDISVDADELLLAYFNPSAASSSAADQFPNLNMFLVFNLLPALGVDLARIKEGDGLSLRVRHSSLLSLMLSLQGRAISKPEDEPLCSASLLGQTQVLSAILEAPKEERLKAFWCAQARVPAWVPFIDGPKLQESGYRWAPATLRYKTQILRGSPLGTDGYADIESGGLGLQIVKPGFIELEREVDDGAPVGLKGKAFRIVDDQGRRYDIARSEDRFNGELPELGRGIAVIVSEWLETHHPRVLIVAVKPQGQLHGQDSELVHCSILCRGIIIVEETFPREVFSADSIVSYKARRVRESQCWLLE